MRLLHLENVKFISTGKVIVKIDINQETNIS